MDISDLEPAYQAFIRDLVARHGLDPERLPLRMAPRDEMFFKGVLPGYPGRPGAALHRYTESALRTFQVYSRLAEHLGGFGSLERVLDFGSGHGRLTRPLLQRLEPWRIWACDIYPEAVGWQAETFGVNGLVSVTDPDRFALRGEFSIVFAGSVFSHLPDGLFQRWLSRLYRLVAPGGLMAFSVHGEAFAPDGQAIGESGIGYAEWSESDSLDPRIYGMSYVTEAYVRAAAAEACGAAAAGAMRCFPRALYESQDLYVIGGEGTDLTGLSIVATPVGGFRKLERLDRPWTGWGVEPNPGEQIVRADLYLDERHAATAAPGPGDADILRFFPGAPNGAVAWGFDPVPAPPGTLLRVELTSSTGAAAQCYAMVPGDPGQPAPRG